MGPIIVSLTRRFDRHRTQPEHRRLVARGFYGKHGDLHEGTAKDKHL